MKTWARTLAINVVILGFLVAAVNFLAVTVNVVETAWGAKEDARGRLPNYADDPWAPTHFREFAALDTEYRSYYGWRRLPFAGETITIDGNGIRRTVQGAKTDPPPQREKSWCAVDVVLQPAPDVGEPTGRRSEASHQRRCQRRTMIFLVAGAGPAMRFFLPSAIWSMIFQRKYRKTSARPA